MPERTDSLTLISRIVDDGSWVRRDEPITALPSDPAYAEDAPTLCLLLGEGAGGGALALFPADRVVAGQHAWLSPLPPEGAAAIMFRTTERAAEMAQAQGVRALDLRAAGIADRIVAERPDAADEPDAYLTRHANALEHELVELHDTDPQARLAARLHRYRHIGS